jgi:hypothetical protein
MAQPSLRPRLATDDDWQLVNMDHALRQCVAARPSVRVYTHHDQNLGVPSDYT